MLKIRFPFFWFLVIYSGTIFPFQMYLMPLFGMYQSVGLYDTRVWNAAILLSHCCALLYICLPQLLHPGCKGK